MIVPDGYSDIPNGKIACVVTHLEMTARPAPLAEPSSAWILRKQERPSVEWFRALYLRVGGDWLWYGRITMPDADLAAKIQSPLVDEYALVNDGREEGLLELDFRKDGNCEIGMFGVTSNLFGSGAGNWLMNRAQELAWSRGVKRVWLHTCTYDHPRALAFYQRAGFRPFRRQIEVEDDPRLTGVAPRHVAPHVPVIE